MKKIALIGDSIRMGYQSKVCDILAGTAETWFPIQNGGDSRNIIQHMTRWIATAKPDIVHINCGLHDVKKAFDTGLPAVPITEYEHNVNGILSQLKQRVSTVIWATTTPVNSAWHHENKTFDRFEEDIIAYNVSALRTAKSLSIQVNDLYIEVMKAGRDNLLLKDGVHFNEQGYDLLAQQVAIVIKPHL